MQLRMSVDGDRPDEEISTLYRMLLADERIRRHASVTVEGGGLRPGEMGTALEVIQLVTNSGFQIAGLALSYAAWRTTRIRPAKVTIEREDGLRITVTDAGPDTIQKIIETFSE
jgi:Effector Associated Constant Component 1